MTKSDYQVLPIAQSVIYVLPHICTCIIRSIESKFRVQKKRDTAEIQLLLSFVLKHANSAHTSAARQQIEVSLTAHVFLLFFYS